MSDNAKQLFSTFNEMNRRIGRLEKLVENQNKIIAGLESKVSDATLEAMREFGEIICKEIRNTRHDMSLQRFYKGKADG